MTRHSDQTEQADQAAREAAAVSRRQFLEAAGFSLSCVALGCGRAPVQTALPLVDHPAGLVPGRMRSYASTCGGCPAGCGLLVGVRDGRPLKMEGLPEHPLSRGGLCAIGQALPLELYDSRRLRGPLARGAETSWQMVDDEIRQKLSGIASDGGAIRLVTPTVTSPTLQSVIDRFLEQFEDGQHVVLDSVSCSAILEAHERTHGARLLPQYKLDQAEVIVSFGADFLGTWISPVQFTAGWRTRRVPAGEPPAMSHHVQLEGRMSLTGSNADRRIPLAPADYGNVLSHLASRLAELAGQAPPPGTPAPAALDERQLADISQRLWDARRAGVVLCDSQDVRLQVLVNYINHLLGNYGHTVDIRRASRQRQGSDRDVLRLVEQLQAGQVSALLVAGVDLTHNLPRRKPLVEAVKNVPLSISFAERVNDFASLAQYVCPDHHPLESWLDAEPIQGLLTLCQPTIQPLGDTRPLLESLARWSPGDSSAPTAAYDILRSFWRGRYLPAGEGFQAAWDRALHDGCVEVEPPAGSHTPLQREAVELVEDPPAGGGYQLVLYTKVGLTDSRHAHNPWLQELPDPVTKVTWDNYVCVSQAVADKHQLTAGDVVRLEAPGVDPLELPALVQPGQQDDVLAVALAYGVRGTERFADVGPQWLEARPTVAPGQPVGANAARFIQPGGQSLHYWRGDVTLSKLDTRHALAATQTYDLLQVPAAVAPHGAQQRRPVQSTTLPAFRRDRRAGAEHAHHFEGDLWPDDHPKQSHWWGMVVDLNACTGCSACLIACQSENNVPVVGKDEVRRRREMHWIRVDRYYHGEGQDVGVSHQPMMCQHCDNAPCETVCPVLATVHSEEGLNEQAYNRCVGTRYCANNCPYKVRRFNWFTYPHDDQTQNLALNPDVTVRTRGVMEKCSMCVQRIEEGKAEARRLGQPLADGAVQTACQQSCPARAIVFGDMNDPDSRVRAALDDPRRYGVLEEFNFKPSVSYLRAVENRPDGHGAEHRDGGGAQGGVEQEPDGPDGQGDGHD